MNRKNLSLAMVVCFLAGTGAAYSLPALLSAGHIEHVTYERVAAAGAQVVCHIGGKIFAPGSHACIAGELHSCLTSGEWKNLKLKC